jgi:hypothetical protein
VDIIGVDFKLAALYPALANHHNAPFPDFGEEPRIV